MSKTYELNKGLPVIQRRIKRMIKKTKPLIIGVAGGSGSGKTTRVAKSLHDCFPGSVILSMDDYFKGRHFMESIGSDNWDEPRALDLDLLKWHLELLKCGLSIQKSIYSFETGTREGYEEFQSADLIILEGLFALHDTIVSRVDCKIFVDISVHGSLLRRLLRDVGRTGQTERDIFRQYVETVYPMYKLHVEPTKSRADVIIVNQYVPEIEAESCQSQEIQIKVFLRREIPLDELAKIGFRLRSSALQQDTYYSAPNWEKNYKGELMRIREEGGRYFLAYKGPVCSGSFRIKPKIEFEVEPGLKDALEKLGYKRTLSLKKIRRKFSERDNLELVMDRIENNGEFLEFRAKNHEGKAEITELLKKLGIRKKDTTKKSYLEILLSKKTSG
ncbi:MAG: class IV adenylate cyclase [Candidatus Nealsonbacteria bacterium]|nr:class IV adenylate cyclase [Candidatus Nealsonbacteria bacterium]